MPSLKLLILDASEVIYLHEIGQWQQVLSRCEVHLARTVVEREARFYKGEEADEVIDLSADIVSGKIKVFDRTIPQLKQFYDQFDPVYLSSLDPGETESLAYLVQSTDDYLISSADAIVFRVLGLLGRGEQGISVEEVFQKVGISFTVTKPHTKWFREKYTKEGAQDLIRGRGLKK